MTGPLLSRIVVPVADPDDARETARALRDAPLPEDASVLVVYVVETASETDASAIVFTPRGGRWWVKLLTGNVATSLVEGSDLPVVVFPDTDENPEADGDSAPGDTDE